MKEGEIDGEQISLFASSEPPSMLTVKFTTNLEFRRCETRSQKIKRVGLSSSIANDMSVAFDHPERQLKSTCFPSW